MGEAGFLGIDHVPFNYRLREARMRLGWTRRRAAEASSVSQNAFGKYEALKAWPSLTIQDRIASALQDAAEYLFPPEVGVSLRGRSARTTTSVLPTETLTLGSGESRLLEAPDPFDVVTNAMLADDIEQVMASITQREKEVISRRFGLDGYEPHTLDAVMAAMGLHSRERVRQIEAKALSKLRHPSRSHRLKAYL